MALRVIALFCASLFEVSCSFHGGSPIPPTAMPHSLSAFAFDTALASSATIIPSTLPIVTDTNPSTAGVFLGEVCDDTAVVSCPNFASTFRHSLSFGVVYANWDDDIGTYVARRQISAWPALGITPLITWQPESAMTPITYAAINSGAYDAYIKTTADEIAALGFTIFLRPFHEFNGRWYPWGLANQGASTATDADFIAAWKRMVGIFRTEHATNVKFVWCFATNSVPSEKQNPWNSPTVAYPGDAFVDWIGFDMYNRGSATGLPWVSFDTVVAPSYQKALLISSAKPVMIAELASNEYGDGGAAKAAWIAQMLADLKSPTASDNYSHLRALAWFDSNLRGYTYDLASSQAVYDEWVTATRSLGPGGILNFRGNATAFNAVTAP